MSMSSWTENGFGFALFTGQNAAMVLEFLKSHEEYMDEETLSALDELEDNAENNGMLDEERLVTGFSDIFDVTVASTIADIINQECGITGFEGFPSNGECGTEDTVMFVPLYPWQMSEKDKSMTMENIQEICRKYCKQLGIPEEAIDFQDLEYYG